LSVKSKRCLIAAMSENHSQMAAAGQKVAPPVPHEGQAMTSSRRREWLALTAGIVLVLQLAFMAHAISLSSSVGGRVAKMVAQPLESRFQRLPEHELAGVKGLVVLGGGIERLREAGRLARRWPHLRVFVSGAGPHAQVWHGLGAGIDPARVTIETLSQTTYENARNSSRLVERQAGERWLLLTSAVHMPRSVAVFRRVGFDVLTWPVADLPEAPESAIRSSLHEWMGLAWYWVRGRGSELLPTAQLG